MKGFIYKLALLGCLLLAVNACDKHSGGHFHHQRSLSEAKLDSRILTKIGWQLPDWSWAGHNDSLAWPQVPKRYYNILDYGATPGGVRDVSGAIQNAVNAAAAVGGGIISIPSGRWRVDLPINITTSRILIKGDGKDATVLYYPKSLSEALPAKYMTPYYESIYCWENAFIRFWGTDAASVKATRLARVIGKKSKGYFGLKVDDASKIQVGDWVRLFQSDPQTDADRGSLVEALYGSVSAPICGGKCFEGLDGQKDLMRWASQVTRIKHNLVIFATPLPLEVDPKWKAELHRMNEDLALRNVGIEDLTMEFKWSLAAPHHQEKGYNGIEFRNVVNSWVKNVKLINIDHGVMVRTSHLVTVSGVDIAVSKSRVAFKGRTSTTKAAVQRSRRHALAEGTFDFDPDGPSRVTQGKANKDVIKEPSGLGEPTDVNGHIGVAVITSTDVRVASFDISTKLIHDVTVVEQAIMTVFQNGKGEDLLLDGHRGAPYATLYSDIQTGQGNRVFGSGGVGDMGFPVGAYTTYWNVRSLGGNIPIKNNTYLGPCTYGGDKLTYVGTFAEGDYCPTSFVERDNNPSPPDIYMAQKKKRLEEDKVSSIQPDAPRSPPPTRKRPAPPPPHYDYVYEYPPGI